MNNRKLERQIDLLKLLAKGCKNTLLIEPLEKLLNDVKSVYLYGKQELNLMKWKQINLQTTSLIK